MANYIDARAERMRKCVKVSTTAEYPLLLVHKLTDLQFATLYNHINLYLFESVSQALPEQHFHLCDDFLVRYAEEIAGLANITPNGLLLPKKHNWLSFNMLFREAAAIVRGFQLQNVTGIHFPVNVRIVNGEPNKGIDTRRRASVKLHSDIWSGELSNHIMMYFPIMGDMAQNGVELFEPGPKFYPDFVRPLDDFDEGKHLIDDSTKYDIVMQPGYVYFLDAFLLHRTMKQTPGLRLVMNFAFLMNMLVPSDIPVDTSRTCEYIKEAIWYEYGTKRLVTTNSVLAKFDIEKGTPQNAYAQKFDTIVL